MNKRLNPDPTQPSAPIPGIPGPADWTVQQDPSPGGAPQNGTPISELPQGGSPDGEEWSPVVQGGITVKLQVSQIAGLAQLPTPVPVSHGGTGQVSFPTDSLLLGGSNQIGAIPAAPQGAVLVGGAPPNWTAVGAAGTILQSLGAGFDPTWATVQLAVIVSPTPPVPPPQLSPGQLWFDATGGNLYVWYVSSGGGAWVDAVGGGPTVVTASWDDGVSAWDNGVTRWDS
jgi:hypothetical protein